MIHRTITLLLVVAVTVQAWCLWWLWRHKVTHKPLPEAMQRESEAYFRQRDIQPGDIANPASDYNREKHARVRLTRREFSV